METVPEEPFEGKRRGSLEPFEGKRRGSMESPPFEVKGRGFSDNPNLRTTLHSSLGKEAMSRLLHHAKRLSRSPKQRKQTRRASADLPPYGQSRKMSLDSNAMDGFRQRASSSSAPCSPFASQRRKSVGITPVTVRDLEKFLSDRENYSKFASFLEEELSGENLMFWNEATQFRKRFDEMNEQQVKTKVVQMCQKYLDEDSEWCVNVAGPIKQSLLKVLQNEEEEILITIFDGMIQDVLQLMTMDPFPRFQKKDFQRLLAEEARSPKQKPKRKLISLHGFLQKGELEKFKRYLRNVRDSERLVKLFSEEDPTSGDTPLLFCLRGRLSSHRPFVDYMLLLHNTEAVDLQINARDIDGNTPVHIALQSSINPEDCLSLLFEFKGVELKRSNDRGCIPLHYFCSKVTTKGNSQANSLLPCVQRFLTVCDVNTPDFSLETPLHRCSLNSDHSAASAVAQALLQQGADPNLRNKRGYSPLHCAIRVTNNLLVQVLLEHGADSELQTTEGLSATELSKIMGTPLSN